VSARRVQATPTLWLASARSDFQLLTSNLIFSLHPSARQPYNGAMKQLTLPIVLERDADGFFVSCPALQGCYSQGDTYEEAVENIKDAIRLHIEDRLADGRTRGPRH